MTIAPDPRLSLNQRTVAGWGLLDAVAACERAGIGWIGLWREQVAEIGTEAARRAVDAADLRVSSLCRGGFFPAPSRDEWERRLEDNRRAVEEAAA